MSLPACSRIAVVTLIFAAACMVSAEMVMVEMADGTKLATEYVLPQGAEGPFPVILVRSVYGRELSPYAERFNGQGYVFVIQDTRGRGDSEGTDNVFADDGWGEHKDGADTVAWILDQEWCDGNIGTWGSSGLGITQTLLAPATEGVRAQMIGVAATNFYGQLAYQGGVFRKYMCEEWVKGQGSEHALAVWKSHPAYDDFWAGYDVDAQAAEVSAPAIHIGGWFDIFQRGTINGFVARHRYGKDLATGNQFLVMAPWTHGAKQMVGELTLPSNYGFDLEALQARLYAHWLKGEENGLELEPAVHYYTLGAVDEPGAPGNEWRTAEDWPPFETQTTLYFLNRNGLLTEKAPNYKEASLSYAFDPADPCPTHGGQNLLLPAGPLDQRKVSKRDDVLKFETKPLTKPVEITGNVRVRLYVGTDAPDTDFTAKLVDIYPDGREMLMLDSIQRLKFRNGFEVAELLPEGETGVVEIDLWDISLIVNKGHKIGVQISSSNFPRFEVNPNTGADFPNYIEKVVDPESIRVARNTVFMDAERPSALILPVRTITAYDTGLGTETDAAAGE
jgi:hypothetical protein